MDYGIGGSRFQAGIFRLATDWRDWRFGVTLRKGSIHGREVWLCFGPLAFEIWWRDWGKR